MKLSKSLYAVIDPQSNVVEKKVYSSEAEALRFIFPLKQIVEITDNPNIEIGGLLVNDKFVSKKPHGSWRLNKKTMQWEAPIKPPGDDKDFFWNESLLTWTPLKNILLNSLSMKEVK